MAPELPAVICEDEESLASALLVYLEGHAITYPSLRELIANADRVDSNSHLFIIDLCNPDDPEGAGTLALLPELRRRFPRADRVVLSAVSDIEVMRATLKAGATRFLCKQLVERELPLILACLRDKSRESRVLDALLLGQSPTLTRFKAELLRTKLDTFSDVLIEGESGVGKEICARFFALPDKNFIAVNAAAIPPDLFESEVFGADKGAFTGASQSRAG